MFTFSVLDLFLQVLSKKSIWHFDVTWLILQRFSREDLKPVIFLLFRNQLLIEKKYARQNKMKNNVAMSGF